MDLNLLGPTKQIHRQLVVYLPLNHSFYPPVRLDEDLLVRFFTQYAIRDVKITHAQLPWSGAPPLTISFLRPVLGGDCVYTTLQVGMCTTGCSPNHSLRLGSVWANIQGSSYDNWRAQENNIHYCPEDHVMTWPHLERVSLVETHVGGKDKPDHMKERRIQWFFTLAFKISGEEGYEYLSLRKFETDIDYFFKGLNF